MSQCRRVSQGEAHWCAACIAPGMLFRIVLAAATAATTVSCLCGPCYPTETGAPTGPLPRDAGAGEPCDYCSDPGDGGCSGLCSAGLDCLNSEKVHDTGRIPLVCSQYCATASCPSGTVCLNAGGWMPGDGALAICLPTCTTDDDCRKGQSAGTCKEFVDAGQRVCHPIGCYENECPAGFGCVEMGCGFGEGVPSSSKPSIRGWCRRLP